MNNEPMLAKSLTDWDRLMAMTDEDIDFSDCPEATPEMFANAIVQTLSHLLIQANIQLPTLS